MISEEKFNKTLWWLMQTIKEDWLLENLDNRDKFIFILQEKTVGAPPLDRQRKGLSKLQDLGVIKYGVYVDKLKTSIQTWKNVTNSNYVYEYEPPNEFEVTLIQPAFDNLYQNYEQSFSDYGKKFYHKSTQSPLVVIDELENEGININRRSQENDAVYWDDSDHLDKIFKDYNLWRQRIKDFLIQSKIISNLSGYFFEADSVPKIKGGIYDNINSPKSQELLKNIRIEISKKLEKLRELRKELEQETNLQTQGERQLKSMHLITDSLEPKSVIFLVLDGQFQMPIRFAVKNNGGDPTSIKKLYNIAYFVDAPNKMVAYDKNTANGINNGLFKRKAVKEYMTNKSKSPTLVQKSKEETLVLKNDIVVKVGLIKNDVPTQYQSLYIDKTR